MKHFLKKILKKLGLLGWIRKLRFRRQYQSLIGKFSGQSVYEVDFNGLQLMFSLKDPFSATFFATHFQNNIYEWEGLSTLMSSVSNNSIVFDVGANIGYFACFAGKCCYNGRVCAFEMSKANLDILNTNILLNKLNNVTVEPYAVADTTAQVLIQDSAVGNAVLKIIEDNSKPDLVKVDAIALDEYCMTRNIAPDFVKIDVEGAEMKVLKGMKNIMSGDIKLLIEIHETDLKYFRSSKEEVLDYIKSFGFNLKTIGNDVKKNTLVFATK